MNASSRIRLAYAALAVVYFVWGSTYVGIRAVVAHMPPFVSAAVRFCAAGLALFVFAVATGRWRRPTLVQVGQSAIVGFLLMGIGNGLVMVAQKSIPSGIAALFVATFPLWLATFEAVLSKGATITASLLGGLALGLTGVALIASARGDISLSGAVAPWGAIVALQIASICWTIGYLYARGLKNRLPVIPTSALEMIAGGLLLGVQSVVFGEDWSRLATAPATAWLGVLYLTVFGSIVGFTAFSFTRHTLPTHIVGTYAYVNPFVAVLLGWWIFDEALSARILGGGALIIAAVIVTSLPSIRAAMSARAPVPAEDDDSR